MMLSFDVLQGVEVYWFGNGILGPRSTIEGIGLVVVIG